MAKATCAFVRRQFEELFEGLISIAPAAQGGERLAQFLVRQGQARFESYRSLEARHGFLESLLHRQHAAQVFMQVWEVRLQRDRQTHGALGFRVAALLAQRVTEQPQVLHAARTAIEIRAAELFGAQWPVDSQRLQRGGDARLFVLSASFI